MQFAGDISKKQHANISGERGSSHVGGQQEIGDVHKIELTGYNSKVKGVGYTQIQRNSIENQHQSGGVEGSSSRKLEGESA
mmetsp:Transcript_6488/g.7275  ORF Transcript_6488/g.7275 Transcript_6488/m.7275 type:complete len:81 (-) Transcript_6488:185-427(-)